MIYIYIYIYIYYANIIRCNSYNIYTDYTVYDTTMELLLLLLHSLCQQRPPNSRPDPAPMSFPSEAYGMEQKLVVVVVVVLVV